MLRSRDILAGAGLKVRLRLQLRWKRKILNTTGFLFVPLIKGKLKNKNLKINELCPVRQVGYCSKFVLKSWKPTFLVFYWSWSRQTKNRADKKQTGSATLPTTAHKLQAVWRIRIKIIRIWFQLSILLFQILTQILLRPKTCKNNEFYVNENFYWNLNKHLKKTNLMTFFNFQMTTFCKNQGSDPDYWLLLRKCGRYTFSTISFFSPLDIPVCSLRPHWAYLTALSASSQLSGIIL